MNHRLRLGKSWSSGIGHCKFVICNSWRAILLLCPSVLICGLAIGAGAADSAPPRTLKSAFQNCFRVGAALNPAQFSGQNTEAVRIITNQFNTISPENVLKWALVHPYPGQYNFGPSDQYVEFGRKYGMFIVGHNLVWHSQTPDWVFSFFGIPASRDALLQRMHEHIQTVVGRYKGKIGGWDVVNEALNEDGALRQTPWMRIIGEDYLVKAYQWAHEADPDAQLYYNDFNMENPAKRAGGVKLIKMLQAHGIHIAAVGMQGHYRMDWPARADINDTINAFAALGVKVMISELDVYFQNPDDPHSLVLSKSAQQALADRYADLFKEFLRHQGAITRVTFWGVGDGDSWLNNDRPNFPLLFDRQYRPTPAYDAVMALAPSK